MFLYFRSRIRVTPRFFEYKVLKLIINEKLKNIVMFLLQVLNPQISPLFKFTFLQVVWPNRGGGFGEIFVTSRSKPCLIFKFYQRYQNIVICKILQCYLISIITGITEIVDVVNLEALDARLYHEPR